MANGNSKTKEPVLEQIIMQEFFIPLFIKGI